MAIGMVATSSRVSEFEASLIKIKTEIYCEGSECYIATGRIVIVNEDYLWSQS